MQQIKDYKEVYEQVLMPVIDESHDPFMSRDLDVDIAVSVRGRILKSISEDEDYELETVDRWPYVFSREGKTQYEDNFSDEAKYMSKRILQVLGENNLSSREVEEIAGHLTEENQSFSTKTLRKGEVKDMLKESSETEYLPEDDIFTQALTESEL